MSGPSVVVRVLGDLKGLSGAVDSAAGKASAGAGRMRGSFDAFLGSVNRSGVLGEFGSAIDGIGASLAGVVEHGKSVGPMLAGVGGAVAGLGLGLAAMGSKDKAAHEQLKVAIENTGRSYSAYSGEVEKAIKHQEKYGDTAHETENALQTLTQATGDPTKAFKLLGEATDLAAAKHIGLTDAATTLGKVYNGNTKVLKEFGITVTKSAPIIKAAETASKNATKADKALGDAKRKLGDLELVDAGKKKLSTAEANRLRDAETKVKASVLLSVDAHRRLGVAQEAAKNATLHQHDAVTKLAAKLQGQGDAAANTFTGHIHAMQAKIEDAASAFGEKFGPALTVAGTALAGVGGAVSAGSAILGTFKTTQEAATTATEAMSSAEDAAAVSEWAALGPIALIVAGVLALIAVGYLIYRNWGTIWKGIHAAISAVWQWIKANWPLLLGILLGPIALAAALIYKYWDNIKAAAGAVVGAIRSAWSALVGFFTGLVASIGRILGGIFNAASNAVGTVVGGIETAWNGLVSFITGIPRRIASTMTGLFQGAVTAVQTVVDTITRIWNDTIGKLKPPSLGALGSAASKALGVVGLQHGGYVTQTGLAYIHAGEVVAPLEKVRAAAGGPTVVVQHAHFETELDVESFMRRAAWVMQTETV
jgi:hypothetical protein